MCRSPAILELNYLGSFFVCSDSSIKNSKMPKLTVSGKVAGQVHKGELTYVDGLSLIL